MKQGIRIEKPVQFSQVETAPSPVKPQGGKLGFFFGLLLLLTYAAAGGCLYLIFKLKWM